MDKHTQDCIRFFEIMAKNFEDKAVGCEHLCIDTGHMDSYHFGLALQHRAVARAYRTCILALKDPHFFERAVDE